jgi:N-acetylglucosamine-6-phosphate deacetylase
LLFQKYGSVTTTITARHLLTDIGSVEYPVLTVSEDGRLSDISSDPRALASATDTLTAAFFDIHTHGALGYDVMSATPAELGEMEQFLASHGVAHYLPTTVTASVDTTLRSLEALADAIERGPGEDRAQPLGIHLEGPFLSHSKRGVHPASELQPPSIELFDRFQAAARGHIQLLTIAPEPNAALNPGALTDTGTPSSRRQRGSEAEAKVGRSTTPALELIRHATGAGVRVSLGHTNATAAQTLAAIDAGATSATHSFNAMRPFDHREPGVLGITLDDDRLYAELICDGIHVAPIAVRLWLRAKGPDRAILVTDAMSAAGMPDGEYRLGGLLVAVAGGRALLADDLAHGKETLAGSALTMKRAVNNLQQFTGATLEAATRCASHNPARMLGRPELTRLAPGSLANLNRFDSQGRLTATCIRGRELRAGR